MQGLALGRAVGLVLLAVAAPAFGQPVAEERAVDGREAWEVARRAGFEFYPVLPDEAHILSGRRDGVATSLKACPSPRDPCRTEAEVVQGRLVALPCDGGCDDPVFELFGGRPLAPGWSLRRVEVTGGPWRWARPPTYGGRDASFAIRLGPRGGHPLQASVRRVVLAGPPGADWRDAFAAPR